VRLGGEKARGVTRAKGCVQSVAPERDMSVAMVNSHNGASGGIARGYHSDGSAQVSGLMLRRYVG